MQERFNYDKIVSHINAETGAAPGPTWEVGVRQLRRSGLMQEAGRLPVLMTAMHGFREQSTLEITAQTFADAVHPPLNQQERVDFMTGATSAMATVKALGEFK